MAGQSEIGPSIAEKGKIFFATKIIQRLLGPNRYPIHWIPEFLSPRSTEPNDADHSTPCDAKVKNVWRYTSTPP